jgi:hypothetical protein
LPRTPRSHQDVPIVTVKPIHQLHRVLPCL